MTSDQQRCFNPVNERSKYKYRAHIRRALKKDNKTIIAILKHIRDFEKFIGFAGFEKFNETIADKYIASLFDADLSLSYIDDNIRTLKEFLRWLERQKGYRSKINYNHIDYLNISANQRKTAKATEYKKSYSYKQIIDTIRKMPDATITQRRNKAIISLQALCGLRISELRTIKLKNLIEEDGNYFIYVNPKDMEVKYAKTRHANFMSLPDDIIINVLEWRDYLIRQGFTDKDPFFPQINSVFNQHNLLENKITNNEIRSNTTIRNVFKSAFEIAGHVYLRPHSFRHTIARFAEKQTPEFLNAIRQSLGHSSIDTTFQSYGKLSEYEQRERISNSIFEFY
ncbi:MAG: site-specific integrase [Rickettsiales bacterium]